MKTSRVIRYFFHLCCIVAAGALIAIKAFAPERVQYPDQTNGVGMTNFPLTNLPPGIEHMTNSIRVDPEWLARNYVASMREDPVLLTNTVNLLAKNGLICRVLGHAWVPHLHTTLEYVPDKIACRECKLCGLHQTQFASDWK